MDRAVHAIGEVVNWICEARAAAATAIAQCLIVDPVPAAEDRLIGQCDS